MLARFPRSPYAGDVLMCLYELTGDAAFLQRLLAQFPVYASGRKPLVSLP
ncbi:MAG: hypothetical protein Q6L68_08515 [Thermostichus sp. DG02_5_bins_236]